MSNGDYDCSRQKYSFESIKDHPLQKIRISNALSLNTILKDLINPALLLITVYLPLNFVPNLLRHVFFLNLESSF